MDVDLAPPGPLTAGGLRVTALGGISEIGRNMTVFEHLGRLLIIDCGVMFPTHDEPGVDLILPDLRHIEDRLDDIEALVLTHAHEDHIGAIPFLLKLRPDIPVVGSKFTLALVAAKCREHRIKPVFVEVKEGQSSRHGVFECEYFAVNHSIPDALAIAVYTGAGTVLHTGDIKLDQLPARRPPHRPARACPGSATPVWTCSCATRPTPSIPGVGPSESEVGPTLHRLIRGADGRVIVACFASNVDRVQQIIDAAVALGRRVSFVGRSMVRNMGIARDLGFLRVADSDLIDIAAAEMMAPDQVVLITTGTQGEPMSALSRMSRGEHRSITLTAGDLIVLSSSLIPGNEEAVYGVIDCAVQDRRPSRHQCPSAGACFGSRVRRRAAVPVQRGAAAPRHAGARDLAACCGPTPSWRPAPECRRSRFCWPRTVSASTWSPARHRIAGAVPVGKMFVDGLITGDVGEITLGERLILSSGFIAVTVVVKRGTGASGGAAASIFARILRRSQGAGARRAQGRGRAGIAGRRQRHRSDPDRAGACAAPSASGWAKRTAGSR